jgi:hypothetical protein
MENPLHKEVLNRHWQELRGKANVLNVALGTKWKAGKDTGIPAIIVLVRKKLLLAELSPKDIVPTELETVPTDIIEVAPITWEAGDTAISRLHPDLQRRRLGLKDKEPPPKAKLLLSDVPVKYNGEAEWTGWASPIQDQRDCGICTAFDIIGFWEGFIRIKENNPSDPIKLSEAHPFFCSGGTCDGGNTMEAVLGQCTKGVCLETCLPYIDRDQQCAENICPNWQDTARKVLQWGTAQGDAKIKSLLDKGPLGATMTVYLSFFNYVSGVYQKLPVDGIAGRHGIALYGYSDPLGAWLLRNSWGLKWGPGCQLPNGKSIPGYCWIAYGNEGIDSVVYNITSEGPMTQPQPAPSCCLLGAWRKIGGLFRRLV